MQTITYYFILFYFLYILIGLTKLKLKFATLTSTVKWIENAKTNMHILNTLFNL